MFLLLLADPAPPPAVLAALARMPTDTAWALAADRAALDAVVEAPAVVLLDAGLSWAVPQQLLAAAHRRFPDSPVLLLTARSEPELIEPWLRAGIADYVRLDDLARLPHAVGCLAAPRATAHNLSEEFYQMLVAQSAEGIWCFELDLPLDLALPLEAQIAHIAGNAVLVECNDAMARMYGYARADELLGARLDSMLDPNDPRNAAYLQAFIRNGYRLVEAESFEHDRDGNERVFLNSLVGTIVDGRLVRAWGTQRDITARVRDEREQDLRAATGSLLAEALAYEATINNVARLLVPAMADYCLIHAAGPAGSQQLTAVHREQAAQQLLDRLGALTSTENAQPAHIIGEVLRTGSSLFQPEVSLEETLAALGEGEAMELFRQLGPRSYIVAPLRARGQVQGALTLARVAGRPPFDRRDLALAEELAGRCAVALDNATLYREARDALQARDELLTIASHELRTPLTAILGFTSVLQRRNARNTRLDERDAHILGALAQQGERLERLISMVLDQARIAAGRLELTREPLDLRALLLLLAAQLEPSLERHQIVVDVGEAPLLVEGDRLRLEQVFLHLLLNALKYSPRGGTIRMTARQRDARVEVQISDQGIGVPPAELSRLGQRFFRATNVNSHQISGTGIGLYVVQGILAAHAGELRIASREGEGTTVTVTMPQAVAEAST
jgi:PAS domain S-box-containing protein